ncbi:unnamed protein product [Schistosoma mattheei]|uniref:Uncharacterized protein n=1 Tax=Schistosoma mattheei TaxID=31246 RepID=A0A183NFP5_9TREM|nr:unnamed protein product [Schistosoma mattheei]
MEDLAITVEEAARGENRRQLYDTTKKLAGNDRKPERPVESKDGKVNQTVSDSGEAITYERTNKIYDNRSWISARNSSNIWLNSILNYLSDENSNSNS